MVVQDEARVVAVPFRGSPTVPPLQQDGETHEGVGCVRRRSRKLARYERAARPIRERILEGAGGRCDVVGVLERAMTRHDVDLHDVLPLTAGKENCWRVGSGLHERRKRSAQGSLVNPANLVVSCGPCNSWIEDHPALAQRLGLVVRSGDPEWDDLSRTNDKEWR